MGLPHEGYSGILCEDSDESVRSLKMENFMNR
jgi:hypothetical protein